MRRPGVGRAKFPLSARGESLIRNEWVGIMVLTLGSERRPLAEKMLEAGKTLTCDLPLKPQTGGDLRHDGNGNLCRGNRADR
jgi:hypothetical protein